MNSNYCTTFLFACFLGLQFLRAESSIPQKASISIEENSIKLGDIELRTGPRQGTYRYISFSSAQRALGLLMDGYEGRGVFVYSWPNLGINLQRGWRGAEDGKIFKFQLYFKNQHEANSDRSTGMFNGHVRVEGIDICATTSFGSIESELKKKGYTIKIESRVTYAKKSGSWGRIMIFSSEESGNVDRMESWCL